MFFSAGGFEEVGDGFFDFQRVAEGIVGGGHLLPVGILMALWGDTPERVKANQLPAFGDKSGAQSQAGPFLRVGILTPCGDTRRAQSQAARDGDVPGRKQPLLLMVLGGHKAAQAEGLTYEPEGEEHEQGAYVPVREAGLIGDGVVEGEEDEEVQSEDGYGVGANP